MVQRTAECCPVEQKKKGIHENFIGLPEKPRNVLEFQAHHEICRSESGFSAVGIIDGGRDAAGKMAEKTDRHERIGSA